MAYHKGQRFCLWQVDLQNHKALVLKEIMVTITEIKTDVPGRLTDISTGVPGDLTGTYTPFESLRALGYDGKVYAKHWDFWPVYKSPWTHTDTSCWSARDDGEGGNKLWTPYEAIHYHNYNVEHNILHGYWNGYSNMYTELVGLTPGSPVLPKGDVLRCEKHNHYYYPGGQCKRCAYESSEEYLDWQKLVRSGCPW